MEFIGKYLEMPREIKKLKALEEVLLEKDNSLEELLGLILDEANYCYYDVTPCDSIPFASLGVDGIHFAFLTDFGEVKDLADAYILMIQPMEIGIDVIKVVARNITEFLSLVLAIKDANFLPELVRLGEEEWENLWAENSAEDFDQVREHLSENLIQVMGIAPLSHAYHYVHQAVEQTREKEITIQTADNIGIKQGKSLINIEIESLDEHTELTLFELKKLFATATTAEKLKFIREAQTFRLLIYQTEIVDYLSTVLLDIGYQEESVRLKQSFF